MSTTSHKNMRELLALMLSPVTATIASPLRFVRWLIQWTQWWTHSTHRRLMAISLIGMMTLAWVGTKTSRLDLRYQATMAARAETVETSYIAPPVILKIFGLGHENFVADLLFLRANMYFTNHLFGDRIFAWLDLYVDTIIALDPDNPTVYEWASQAVKFGQFISTESLERSNAIAQRGIERFPDHWRFYFDIGFNYRFEWDPADEAERQAMRDKAIPYFSIAAMLPGSKIDPNFLAALHLQRDDVEMALFLAYNRYWEANEHQKTQLRLRIGRYESQAAAESLQAVEQRWKSTHPYVPLSLFELLDPPRTLSVPVNWADQTDNKTTHKVSG